MLTTLEFNFLRKVYVSSLNHIIATNKKIQYYFKLNKCPGFSDTIIMFSLWWEIKRHIITVASDSLSADLIYFLYRESRKKESNSSTLKNLS